MYDDRFHCPNMGNVRANLLTLVAKKLCAKQMLRTVVQNDCSFARNPLCGGGEPSPGPTILTVGPLDSSTTTSRGGPRWWSGGDAWFTMQASEALKHVGLL